MSKSRQHVLFVCTGNICRSPMAEYFLKHYLGPNPAWQVSSAGFSAVEGQPASPAAIEAMRKKKMDLTPHRSRGLTQDMIDSATMIVVMTAAQAQIIKQRYSEAQDRLYLLKSFSPRLKNGDIEDPIGSALDFYRQTRDTIEEAVLDLVLYLKACEKSG